MIQGNEEFIDLEKAYRIWIQSYPYRDLDKAVEPFLQIDSSKGWLKRTRKALFLSSEEVAKRLGVSRSGYLMFESRELNGEVNLKKLDKVAEVMGCEVIYMIRPRSRTLFSKIIWQALLPDSTKHGWLRKCFQKNNSMALAAISKRIMKKTAVRKKLGWSRQL